MGLDFFAQYRMIISRMKRSLSFLFKQSTPTGQGGAVSLRPVVLMGLLAILAPLSYLVGRYTTPETPAGLLRAFTSTLWLVGLGAILGIPVGLFFGAMRSSSTNATPVDKAEVLDQLRTELTENQQLFLARKGSATIVARLGYVTSYWESAQHSGQLSAIARPSQLSRISLAYYWLNQANHLEMLAYDAKNGGVARDPEFTTAKLISEVRLLDEPIEKAITAALSAVADLA